MRTRYIALRAAITGAAASIWVLGGYGVALAQPATQNVAQHWNQVAENALIASGPFQNECLIYMAYASAAVYDAVTSIDRTYRPLFERIHARAGASPDAAVAEAAYRTLRFYLPGQATLLDAAYFEALAQLPGGRATEDGLEIGARAAAIVIARRRGDGLTTPIGATSVFDSLLQNPGVWRLTPPFAAPQTPWVGSVRPFVLRGARRFRPAGPPPLDSANWVQQFDEIKRLGSSASTARTPEQTAVARFWTANVIRQYNRAGRDLSSSRGLSLGETARLLAMINVIGADAQIEVMRWKYTFLFWRPVTAIDPNAVTTDGFGPVPGFDDGIPQTIEESGWRPLITTPNHPEYPAAHGSITSAMASVFAEILGTDSIALDIHGFDPAGATGNLDAVRHFATTDALRAEIVNARLWAGLHYRGSSEAGVALGRDVARVDLRRAFRKNADRPDN